MDWFARFREQQQEIQNSIAARSAADIQVAAGAHDVGGKKTVGDELGQPVRGPARVGVARVRDGLP